MQQERPERMASCENLPGTSHLAIISTRQRHSDCRNEMPSREQSRHTAAHTRSCGSERSLPVLEASSSRWNCSGWRQYTLAASHLISIFYSIWWHERCCDCRSQVTWACVYPCILTKSNHNSLRALTKAYVMFCFSTKSSSCIRRNFTP